MKNHRAIVIGGGPAGMMAALTAARSNKQVILIEKNPQLGKKLAITGGGRCNVTNLTDPDEMIKKTVTNGRFLYGAFNSLSSKELMKQLEAMGIPLKLEEDNKVFPVSNRSGDVIEGFYSSLRQLGVELIFNRSVAEIMSDSNSIIGVRLDNNERIKGTSVILATGGASYPTTGSNGEGYSLAGGLGHSIRKPKAALVPIVTKEEWVKELMGISITDAEISFKAEKKKPFTVRGPIIFTHFGLSGPAILELSSHLNSLIDKGSINLRLDLLPQVSTEELENTLIRPEALNADMSIRRYLNQYLPKNLLQILMERGAIDGDVPLKQLTKKARTKLLMLLKNMEVTAISLRSLKEAIVTSGGIEVKEINPKTMESKLVKGLYFAGEIIDVDAVTGGYNLHIAFSTGYLAGLNA